MESGSSCRQASHTKYYLFSSFISHDLVFLIQFTKIKGKNDGNSTTNQKDIKAVSEIQLKLKNKLPLLLA